jgi:putative aldouronate transport system permease protein
MALLPVAWYIIFCYVPMYGIQLAFKEFRPSRGIWGSPWVGFEHFERFFSSIYFGRVVGNTLIINVYSLIFGFPVPIIFALLLNEIRFNPFKRIIQTVTYFPHFISTVIVVSMLTMLFAADTGVLNFTGIFNNGVNIPITNDPAFFRPLYIGSGIWQGFGFSSVLYIAAISAIDQQLYEAARVDGASRFQNIIHITLPCIMPAIIIRLLLQLGSMFSQGAEKIILMYTPSTYVVADVISTYVYRVGLTGANYSFGTAVDLFNTIINFITLIVFNTIARRMGETSLW